MCFWISFWRAAKLSLMQKKPFLINAIFHQFLENCTIQSRKIFEKVTFQKGNTFYGTSSVLFGILNNISGSNYVSHFRNEFVFPKLEKLNHFFREINFRKISWNWFHEKKIFGLSVKNESITNQMAIDRLKDIKACILLWRHLCNQSLGSLFRWFKHNIFSPT